MLLRSDMNARTPLTSMFPPGWNVYNQNRVVTSENTLAPTFLTRTPAASACPQSVAAWCYGRSMTYPLTAAQARLAELVAEARRSHRPVTISEHGRPVAALINVDDLADLEDRAALAAHLADKAAGRGGIGLDELDAALDWIDAETLA
jgi:prevent-host-death family protein